MRFVNILNLNFGAKRGAYFPNRIIYSSGACLPMQRILEIATYRPTNGGASVN